MPDIALPGPLRLTPSLPFVGRTEELGVLERLRCEAARDGRRVAFVQGEPGSGKTRLVRQVAERAAGDGAGVLYGAWDPSPSRPYQGFVEALEQLVEREPALVTRAAAGPRAGELAALLPGIAGDAAPAAPAGDPEPRGGRHRLHAAVTALLGASARGRPLVLVLDDAHWADAPSLALLRHLARAGGDLPLLVLVTVRPLEAEVDPDLADALAVLHRLEGVARVPLGAFAVAEIAEFLDRLAPVPGDHRVHALAAALLRLTGGNAFLVAELAQHLVDAGVLAGGGATDDVLRAAGIPEGVRDVVAQRLGRMTPAARGIVELAAVVPRAVELAVLRTATGLDDGGLLAALDETSASRVLEEAPGPPIAFRFRHELLRRAVADRLPAARRAALHLRVATALEAVHGRDGDRDVSDLAMHFAEAAELGGRERASAYALRAAQAAMRSLAYEDAARHLRGALDLGVEPPAVRARALCDLGAALHRAGNAPHALASYAAAADLARETGETGRFAEAAIGFENACWRPGLGDARSVELLTEAVDTAAARDGALRVRLLAGQSRALAYRGDHAAAGRAWRGAVDLARQVGDRRALAVTLFHAAWTRGSQPAADVLASLDEARELFGALGEDDLRHEADGFRLSLLLEAFDTEGLRRGLRTFRAEVERVGQPFYLHVHAHISSTLALCDGRLGAADTMATHAYDLSRQFDEDASAIHGIQLFALRREQGRLGEVAGAIRLITARRREAADVWGPALAVLLAELGLLDDARRELERLCADDLALVPRGGLWLGGLAFLADACALVDDARLAGRVYGELSRLEGMNVVIGQGVACFGAADRFLGVLATTMGDLRTAEGHFEAALELNTRLASPTWLAHTRLAYAHALRRRGRTGDAPRAEALLGDAARDAGRFGLTALADRSRRAGAPPAGAVRTALPHDLSAREAEVLRLVASGRSNREIGDALQISRHTAANHVRSILAKTACTNRTEAASFAHRHALA